MTSVRTQAMQQMRFSFLPVLLAVVFGGCTGTEPPRSGPEDDQLIEIPDEPETEDEPQPIAEGFDATFGDGGVTELGETEIFGYMPSYIDSEGRVVVAYENSNGKIVVVRLLRDGTFDPEFGDSGKATLDLAERAFNHRESIAPLPDGGVIVGTSNADSHSDAVIIRLTPSGKVDADYGDHGTITIGEHFQSLTTLPDGKVVVVTEYTLHKYLSTGKPDLSFGTSGKKQIVNCYRAYDEGLSEMTIEQVAIHADGRLLVLTSCQDYWDNNDIVDRDYFADLLMPDGSDDTSFGFQAASPQREGMQFLFSNWDQRQIVEGTLSIHTDSVYSVVVQRYSVDYGDSTELHWYDPEGDRSSYHSSNYFHYLEKNPSQGVRRLWDLEWTNDNKVYALRTEGIRDFLVRYEADLGQAVQGENFMPDMSFHDEGKLLLSPIEIHRASIHLQDDGKVVIVATDRVARINP